MQFLGISLGRKKALQRFTLFVMTWVVGERFPLSVLIWAR